MLRLIIVSIKLLAIHKDSPVWSARIYFLSAFAWAIISGEGIMGASGCLTLPNNLFYYLKAIFGGESFPILDFSKFIKGSGSSESETASWSTSFLLSIDP